MSYPKELQDAATAFFKGLAQHAKTEQNADVATPPATAEAPKVEAAKAPEVNDQANDAMAKKIEALEKEVAELKAQAAGLTVSLNSALAVGNDLNAKLATIVAAETVKANEVKQTATNVNEKKNEDREMMTMFNEALKNLTK